MLGRKYSDTNSVFMGNYETAMGTIWTSATKEVKNVTIDHIGDQSVKHVFSDCTSIHRFVIRAIQATPSN